MLKCSTVLPLALYVHIPFCTTKCSYCDFNSYARLEHLMPSFTETLCDDARLWGNVMLRSSYESPSTSLRAGLRTSGRDGARRRRVQTVFFGGGTPSLMSLPNLERIVAALRDSFEISPDAEVSLEANPGTAGLEYLRGLLRLGVNRISFGVQSFHDDELLALGRIHSAKEARDSFLSAREAGFRRINLDLIYGLSGQTLERWRSNVEEAISLRPEHLSLYALTIEEGTKLAQDIELGRTAAPDPDLQAGMYGWSQERLARAGYRQYEISNWAIEGEECRHNLVYWRNGEWLGLGPGAHSHLARKKEEGRRKEEELERRKEDEALAYRFACVSSPGQYIRKVRQTAGAGIDVADGLASVLRSMRQVTFVEPQSREMEMADTAILALRLNEGLSSGEFRDRFGLAPDEAYAGPLRELTSLGLLERENGNIRLTERGRYLSNEVFVRLLP